MCPCSLTLNAGLYSVYNYSISNIECYEAEMKHASKKLDYQANTERYVAIFMFIVITLILTKSLLIVLT